MLEMNYIPNRGDIIWLDFNPQIGSEQKGRRPALVISPLMYNQKVGLVIVMPITSQVKNYPFEVLIPNNYNTNGVILTDQIKSLDWRQRNSVFIENLEVEILKECINKVSKLLLLFKN